MRFGVIGTNFVSDWFLEPFVAAAFEKTRFTLVKAGPAPRLINGRLHVPPALLEELARESFRRLAFYLRRSHLELLAGRLEDPASSGNDRLVIRALLKNALIAARGELALCQDTGTAVIYGWKDESVFTGASDGEALSRGAAAAYGENYLRASQVGALSFFDEFDTGDNLPAQVQIASSRDGPEGAVYRFLCIAKGGGSSNKTGLFSMTKALLEEGPFNLFLEEKIKALGAAACPPYRIVLAAGGPSPEYNLEILKLGSSEILDAVPYFDGAPCASIRRDRHWEERIMDIGRESGLGAQFGGTSLVLDARVFRMPRHAASCFVSVGVSCSAHRNLLGYIDREGIHLEQLEEDPGGFLESRGVVLKAADSSGGPAGAGETAPPPRIRRRARSAKVPPRICLDKPMKEILACLGGFAPGDQILLSGKLLLARDAAHLAWRALLAEGKPLPDYLYRHPIYYAGPAAAPPGKIIGSLGPTTAQRMDPYGDAFMSRGVSLVTLAKGNRSPQWAAACKKYGGFYLGTIGGAGALLSEEHVAAAEILDYPELGMEAVRLIEVRDLTAFVIMDDKGNDLYRS
jgi:fumarate hydratase class I